MGLDGLVFSLQSFGELGDVFFFVVLCLVSAFVSFKIPRKNMVRNGLRFVGQMVYSLHRIELPPRLDLGNSQIIMS